jgi:hypothetical protein
MNLAKTYTFNLYKLPGMKIVLIMIAALLAAPAATVSAELLMVEAPYCEWCEQWDAEVGIVYAKTPEGKIAPLRRVAMGEVRAGDIPGLERVIYTPTFILMDDGLEIGRITGYPGESHFWGLLGELIAMIDSDVSACEHPADRAPGEMAQPEELKC